MKIVFYGQSITSAESQHWWKEVSRYLHATYPHANLVIENRAISGHGSERLVKTAEADIYPFQPDLIIFHVYGSHIEYENIFRRIRQRTCADIIEQTDHITKDQALSEVTDPVKLTPRQWDAWMNNSFLPSNAARYDVCLADVHSLWKNYMKATGAKASDMLRDGIHLNARGDWLMAELIKPYLAPLPAKDEYDPHNTAGVSTMIPQTTPGQNSLRVQWTGTRVDLVFRPDAKGQVTVRVDGQKPSAIPSLYCFSRSSPLPGRDWPLLLRVGNQSPLVAEEWALTLQSLTPDGKSGRFVLKGSVTGDDGEGDLASRFISRSGRVVIEPDDWNIAYCVAGYRQPLPSSHTITWKAWLQGTDIATPSRQAPGVENAVTLAQNLAGGQHTLELQGDDLGQQIQCLRFYCPRDAVDPETQKQPAGIATPTKVVIVDDFESYTNDQQLAKAWYKPPHGGGTHQTRESTIKNSGGYSLKVEYTTTKSDDKFYSPICRVSQWNLAGCNALQFWFKPDGSGRALLFGMNIASKEGKNIHDLWEYTYVPKKGDTTPHIVTVPFSKLVKNAKYADSPDTSPVFKPEALIEVGLCIGGRNDEPGEGVYYFDDFRGVWLAQPSGVQAEPGGSPDGADLIDVAVVSDRILWLEFNDGWVKHSGYHEPRNRCVVHRWPLDLAAAAQAANYTLSSNDDADYGGGRHPTDIGRKSKGNDFAGGTGEVVNNHYLYLFFAQPLKPGKSYELSVGTLAVNLKTWPIRYDFRSTRSEAVHVNQLGYAPRAPVKVGYVSQWMGDRGPLDLSAFEGRPFHLVPARGGEIAFSGKVKQRTPQTHLDSAVPKDVPHQNWSNADVCECDFSSFGQPGEYVLAVEGLGCSYPFRINEDVYRDAFYVTCRGLYHHRAGIELKRPHTTWKRKADTHEGHISHPVWGWYHDAGDWDGYGSHSLVPRYLLLAFELAPRNFSDGELNLPESGNGLPDLLDEATWLIQYYRRSRAVFAGGVTGGRVDGDAAGDFPEQNGYPSYEDTRKWVVQGATTEMTYGYAGLAANLAYCYRQISSQTQQLEAAIADWTREAKSAYAWAEAHDGSTEAKAYASAWLYKLTGEEAFHVKFKEANAVKSADQTIGGSWNGGWSTWACFAYATLPDGAGHPELKQAIRGAVLKAADAYVLEPARRHTYRVGRDPYLPSFLGKLTTPVPHEAMVAYALTGKPEYLAVVFTTADYFLGGNPLNMTWVTGLGQRCPREVLNLDAWALEYREFQPGIVPYGPSTQDFMGPNSVYAAFWAYDRLYPTRDSWPLAEMWCDNRYAVASGEYTVWQTIAPAAATYAYLCSAARHSTPNRNPSIHISTAKDSVEVNQIVSLRGETTDPDGWIARVDYFADKRFIGRAITEPFGLDWQPSTPGECNIEAQAYDNRGAKSYSNPIRILIVSAASRE